MPTITQALQIHCSFIQKHPACAPIRYKVNRLTVLLPEQPLLKSLDVQAELRP